jgi:hypothetical protein
VGWVVMAQGAEVHERCHVVAGSSMGGCTLPQGCGIRRPQLQSQVEGLAAATGGSGFDSNVSAGPLGRQGCVACALCNAGWQGLPKLTAVKQKESFTCSYRTHNDNLCSCSPPKPLGAAADS